MNNHKLKIAEFIKADKYADAFIYCGKELRENPNDQEVCETAAFIFQRIQDAHIEIDAKTAEEYTLRGIAYFYVGQVESSIHDYSKAIELDETYDYAYKCRHFSYAASGKINESLKDIIKAIELNPSSGLYYFDCANLLSHIPDKKAKSLDYYHKSVELDPINFLFWYTSELSW